MKEGEKEAGSKSTERLGNEATNNTKLDSRNSRLRNRAQA